MSGTGFESGSDPPGPHALDGEQLGCATGHAEPNGADRVTGPSIEGGVCAPLLLPADHSESSSDLAQDSGTGLASHSELRESLERESPAGGSVPRAPPSLTDLSDTEHCHLDVRKKLADCIRDSQWRYNFRSRQCIDERVCSRDRQGNGAQSSPLPTVSEAGENKLLHVSRSGDLCCHDDDVTRLAETGHLLLCQTCETLGTPSAECVEHEAILVHLNDYLKLFNKVHWEGRVQDGTVRYQFFLIKTPAILEILKKGEFHSCGQGNPPEGPWKAHLNDLPVTPSFRQNLLLFARLRSRRRNPKDGHLFETVGRVFIDGHSHHAVQLCFRREVIAPSLNCECESHVYLDKDTFEYLFKEYRWISWLGNNQIMHVVFKPLEYFPSFEQLRVLYGENVCAGYPGGIPPGCWEFHLARLPRLRRNLATILIKITNLQEAVRCLCSVVDKGDEEFQSMEESFYSAASKLTSTAISEGLQCSREEGGTSTSSPGRLRESPVLSGTPDEDSETSLERFQRIRRMFLALSMEDDIVLRAVTQHYAPALLEEAIITDEDLYEAALDVYFELRDSLPDASAEEDEAMAPEDLIRKVRSRLENRHRPRSSTPKRTAASIAQAAVPSLAQEIENLGLGEGSSRMDLDQVFSPSLEPRSVVLTYEQFRTDLEAGPEPEGETLNLRSVTIVYSDGEDGPTSSDSDSDSDLGSFDLQAEIDRAEEMLRQEDEEIASSDGRGLPEVLRNDALTCGISYGC